MKQNKKKHVELLPKVKDFLRNQSGEVKKEFNTIVYRLEMIGTLEMPYGEKVDGDLFAIRVIDAGNIRVFYVYGLGVIIYAIHGYEKKSRAIPEKELAKAVTIVKFLRIQGVIK